MLKEHKQRHKSKKKLSKKNERDASLRLLGVNIATNSPIKLVCFMKKLSESIKGSSFLVQLRRKACELRSGREANYAKSVLEETLEEISESGTFLALTESVAKSRERNREKDQVRARS